MRIIPLSDLEINTVAVVRAYAKTTPYLYRLKELGLTEGVKVIMEYASFFNSTVCLRFRGSRFLLRRNLLQNVTVEI